MRMSIFDLLDFVPCVEGSARVDVRRVYNNGLLVYEKGAFAMKLVPDVYSYYNGRPNAIAVDMGDLTLYYSYRTVVGFWEAGFGFTLSENLWGNTTGKHINLIGGEATQERLPRADFEARLKEALVRNAVRRVS